MAAATTPVRPVRLLLGAYQPTIYDAIFTPPTDTSPPSLAVTRRLDIGPNASWLAPHPTIHDIWYAAIEAVEDGDVAEVVVFRLGKTGSKVLGRVSAIGSPCHVVVVASGRGLAVANYHGGSAFLVPLLPDGTFAHTDNATPNFVQFKSLAGPVPWAHQCVEVPSKNEVWVVDTGNNGVWRMKLSEDEGGLLRWEIGSYEETRDGEAPRQIIVSDDATQMYTLHARSCLVTHDDLRQPFGSPGRNISTYDITPPGHKVDMKTRPAMDMPLAAALTLHAPSQYITATTRLLKGEQVDSVAFMKLLPEGTLSAPKILRPKRGREYRGVGFVGDCFLVAGQGDGWMTCFQWNKLTDEWEEKEWAEPVRLEKVVWIGECS
ncbi:hypothetical protein IAT38_001452 [Cryptococcus sp. DSM 104549]